MMKILSACLLVLLSVQMTACSTVKPWQRGHLGKDIMKGAPIEQKQQLDEHIYFSKEGASGGGRSAGGGCGCN